MAARVLIAMHSGILHRLFFCYARTHHRLSEDVIGDTQITQVFRRLSAVCHLEAP